MARMPHVSGVTLTNKRGTRLGHRVAWAVDRKAVAAVAAVAYAP